MRASTPRPIGANPQGRLRGRPAGALRVLAWPWLVGAMLALASSPLRAEDVANPSGLPLPRFVSLKSDRVNVRKGPGTNYPIAWVFSRAGLPVEVIREFENWRQIRDSEGAMVVANGHKQAFCMLDTVSWAWPLALPVFDCANQGISRGFSDFYDAGLPCQWIDITGVAPGDYTLRIDVNKPRPDAALPILVERDYGNNSLEVLVTIP